MEEERGEAAAWGPWQQEASFAYTTEHSAGGVGRRGRGVGGDVLLLILVYVHLTFHKLPTWISPIRYLCSLINILLSHRSEEMYEFK